MSGTTEAFSRVKIDALLKDAGWDLTDGVSVLFEHALPDGSRADYALCDRSGRPVAAVEAKRASVNPLAAQDQGRHYAEQLGVPFAFLSNGEEVWFLDRETDAHARKVATFYSPRTTWSDGSRPAGIRLELSGVEIAPADRRSRLPDRLHRGAVRRSVTRPAQAARGDGDGNRQDPHGGGIR